GCSAQATTLVLTGRGGGQAHTRGSRRTAGCPPGGVNRPPPGGPAQSCFEGDAPTPWPCDPSGTAGQDEPGGGDTFPMLGRDYYPSMYCLRQKRTVVTPSPCGGMVMNNRPETHCRNKRKQIAGCRTTTSHVPCPTVLRVSL